MLRVFYGCFKFNLNFPHFLAMSAIILIDGADGRSTDKCSIYCASTTFKAPSFRVNHMRAINSYLWNSMKFIINKNIGNIGKMCVSSFLLQIFIYSAEHSADCKVLLAKIVLASSKFFLTICTDRILLYKWYQWVIIDQCRIFHCGMTGAVHWMLGIFSSEYTTQPSSAPHHRIYNR